MRSYSGIGSRKSGLTSSHDPDAGRQRRASLKAGLEAASADRILVIVLILCLCGVNVRASIGKEGGKKSNRVPPILVADFNKGVLKTELDESEIGTWKINPGDPLQACDISIAKGLEVSEKKAALALDYMVKSDLPDRAKVGIWMKLGSLNLQSYNTLEIELKGDNERGYPKTLRIEIRKPHPEKAGEMISASWLVKGISSKWKSLRAPLSRMSGISEWTDIRELVITIVDRLSDKRTGRIYLGRIEFKKKGTAPPWQGDIYERKKIKPSDAFKGRGRAEIQVGRLRGFPEKAVVDRLSPENSREFLQVLAKDTWKFFENIVDKETGIPLDTIIVSTPEAMGQNTVIGDYTNITNIGLYLMTFPAAEDLGFLTHEEAESRVLLVLKSLKKMKRYKGFFFNYYDTTTLERTTHFISSVDTGWLLAGLIIIRNSYPGRAAEIAGIMIKDMDMRFFYDPAERLLYHGYFSNIHSHSEYHYGTFFTEARVTSFIAIGKGDIPAENWFAMDRTFSADMDWQSQVPQGRKPALVSGQRFYSGHYVWNGKPIVPSWGGSMFEALMPGLIINEKKLSPKGWWLNGLRHAQAQVDFARSNDYAVWGMSPCSDPYGKYGEFGVKPVGIKGYPAGIVTPHASFLALSVIQDAAIDNLRKLIREYPDIYGEYGFYDAVDPKNGKVAYRYLALDQAMSFLSLANILNPGKLYERFHGDSIVKKAEILLQSESPLPE